MAMNVTYRNAIANHGASLIKYIGLVNGLGQELTGGGYARQAVTWTQADDGTIRPSEDLVFDVPAGATVAGFRCYSAATGGTDYGGESLTAETFAGAGQYKLIASGTGILHE
jgi:hypothetical protein